MLTSSPAYKLALLQSHRRVSRFTVSTPDGELLAEDVPIGGGQVTAQLTSRVSRSASFTASDEWFPVAADDPMSPYHAIVQIRAGIAYPSGEEELFPIFTGRVYEAAREADGQVTFRADDLAADVIAAYFEQPENSVLGRSTVAEMQRLIVDGYEWATFGTNDVEDSFVPKLSWDDDRGKALDDLAATLEGRWFALGDGSFVVRRNNYTGEAPVAEIKDGPAGTLSAARIVVTADGSYNSVVVVAERPDTATPIRVTERDMNPSSPSYYGGRFGKRVLKIRSQEALAFFDAQRVARSQLAASTALQRQWTMTAVPDMTREPGDVVSTEWRGVRDTQVIDSLTYPLSPAVAQGISARSSVAASA
jgi:hypothetical protein